MTSYLFPRKSSNKSEITLLASAFGVWLVVILLPNSSAGQVTERGRQLEYSQQFRQAERIIRIAEPGQIADTVNVWGDVNSPGRYLIPRGTELPELISYGFGPTGIRDRETALDWSKVRVEVNVSTYDGKNRKEQIKTFNFRYNEPLPEGIRTFNLKNNQVVSVQVKRKPAFIDYVRVVAPIISGVATSILIVERLNN